MIPLSRRHFLRLSGGALVVSQALAIEPFKRAGEPRLLLSLAAYSFRDYFKNATHKQNPQGEQRLDIPGFIDYCADHGCAGAELTSYYFPPDVTDDYLREVRRHAFLRGIAISGTSVGNNFAVAKGELLDQQIALVKTWVDRAAILGAPHIRVFAGAPAKGADVAAATKQCIEVLEEACAYAGSRGIFLGLENHGGIVAEPEQLLAIVKAVKSPWLGINLDTGNFHTADPYEGLAQCAPFAVNVQVKADIRRAGAAADERSDLPRIAKILRDANYQGWVALEYEAKESPWTAVPPLLAKLGEVCAAPAKGSAAAGVLPLFDGKSLAGWKVTEFSGRGDVEVKDGAIILEAGNDLTGITYPGELPKTNYEVQLEAQRVDGSDFFCGLTIPVGDAHCTFVVGGWGGGIVGISSINGDDASENSTTQTKKFDKGRWYKIRARVTPSKLETWIDDEQMASVDLAEVKLSMRHGEIELSEPFGIASYRTRAALRAITLRKL